MDKEDYFDKYFQMDTILIIFFYKYIILILNSQLFLILLATVGWLKCMEYNEPYLLCR